MAAGLRRTQMTKNASDRSRLEINTMVFATDDKFVMPTPVSGQTAAYAVVTTGVKQSKISSV